MDAIGAFDLTKYYGVKPGAMPTGRPALQGINLQVPEGGAVACVGREGAGKTTLVRLMAGLGRPTSGECSVLGLSPSHEAARLHSMTGTVLHSAKLYSSMSLWNNLLFFAGANGLTKNEGVERVSFLLHRLNLWEDREKIPAQLPSGELKRAGLARAMIHRPRVLLFDEQGSGMDRETAGLVRELLDYALKEEGVTLLYCTENMNYAQTVCGGFALLDRGILMARGDLETLRVGGGVRLKAALRLAENQPGPEGFSRRDGFWEKEIQSEDEMPGLIARVVGQGSSLYEARLVRPSLEEIYDAYLAGGRRREAVFHGETHPAQPEPTGAEAPAALGAEGG